MKVYVQGSLAPGMKTVTFIDDGTKHVYLMPEKLAESLRIRLHAFKYGILVDGKELIAMFKDKDDRDALLSLEHIQPEIDQRMSAYDVEGE